jgi:hypothetical protein
MYEMEGASSALPHQGSQSPGQLALRAARQGQAPARKSGFPVFPTFRSFPRVVPVSDGEVFLSLPRAPAQELFRVISNYFSVHIISTDRGQFSADDARYPRDNSQLIHRLPTDYQG